MELLTKITDSLSVIQSWIVLFNFLFNFLLLFILIKTADNENLRKIAKHFQALINLEKYKIYSEDIKKVKEENPTLRKIQTEQEAKKLDNIAYPDKEKGGEL